MTETNQQNDGWETNKVYTVIQNVTKNSKVVLSNLNGIEIMPGQTLDLRTAFRKSQVQDAVHEIASLIRTGHLKDVGANAEDRVGVTAAAAGGLDPAEMKKRMKDAMIREISDSTNMGLLEDQIKSTDPEIAKAATIRAEMLLGKRDDQGVIIPGHEEDEQPATPTQIIRSPSTDPALQEAAPGVVRRAP